VPNIAKIRAAIGWVPRIALDETLREVIAFYRASPAAEVDEG
jgi:nucleoside-diphosphate-sugar epimerase